MKNSRVHPTCHLSTHSLVFSQGHSPPSYSIYIYIHVYTLFYCWQEKAISIFSMTANMAPFPTLFSSYKKLMFVPHRVPDIELSFPFYFFKANGFFWRTRIDLNIIFAVCPGFISALQAPSTQTFWRLQVSSKKSVQFSS